MQFCLQIAAPCGADNLKKLDILGMDRSVRFFVVLASSLPFRLTPSFASLHLFSYLDFWNLMAYDFAGSWSDVTSHQAQLYGHSSEPSVDGAVQFYRRQGVRADKLVVGMPLYGRSFAKTDGLGHKFSGVGEGTWEAVSRSRRIGLALVR